MRSGILNVAKPRGPSSFAVVRTVRRVTGIDPVGHGGTLDPAADGVLPILLGRATRLADFVHEWPKTYLATLQLGSISDTYDREGTISASGDYRALTRAAIEPLLPAFIGRIAQVPPMYSALKRGGEALYRKARRGQIVDRTPREVDVYSLDLTSYDPATGICHLKVTCGKGVYVRSLAKDIGVSLGCGAYLNALTRAAFGPLRLEDAVSPASLLEAGLGWDRWLLPMDLPLREWPSVSLDEGRASAVRNGRAIPVPEARILGRHRLLDPDGRLLAWGAADGTGRIHPSAVFPP